MASDQINKIDEMGLRGPINGMGENDLRGDYYRLAITFEDDEFVRGRVTLAQLRELRDEIDHFISKAS